MTYAERTNQLTTEEDAALEAEDVDALHTCLNQQKDHMVELARASQAGDKDAEMELVVMRRWRQETHPRVVALVEKVAEQVGVCACPTT